jgi:hypothetical protein
MSRFAKKERLFVLSQENTLNSGLFRSFYGELEHKFVVFIRAHDQLVSICLAKHLHSYVLTELLGQKHKQRFQEDSD